MIPTNATIRIARRAANRDEYGQARAEDVVMENVRVRFDSRQSTRQLNDGSFLQTDGEVTIEVPWELAIGDVVFVKVDGKRTAGDVGDCYKVLSSDGSMDVMGETLFNTYQLSFNPMAQPGDEDAPRF